jgi:cell wall-associated NlpC family hydrolase
MGTIEISELAHQTYRRHQRHRPAADVTACHGQLVAEQARRSERSVVAQPAAAGKVPVPAEMYGPSWPSPRQRPQQMLNISAACGTFQQTVQQRAADFSGSRAMVAVQFACAQLGKPYVWGGNGDPGFDCSGLTKAAYATAGITLPRVAQDQFNAGPVVSGQPLLPGDLLFFGASASTVTHVGIALSSTEMINSPDVGLPVRVDHINGHLVGVTRPAGRAQR